MSMHRKSHLIYIAKNSVFQHWAFSDIRTGRVLTKVSDATSQNGKWIVISTKYHSNLEKRSLGKINPNKKKQCKIVLCSEDTVTMFRRKGDCCDISC